MLVIFWTIVGFLVGSIPFSVIFGKLFAKADIRTVGDGNPGAMNALKAGGLKAGIPSYVMDIFKGFLPVYLAQKYGMAGWSLVSISLAPILGHAFSPFLHFRGGKALGPTAGVWIGLIGLWALPLYAILTVPAYVLQSEDAWSANIGMLTALVYAILLHEAWLVVFAILNIALLVWKHRHDLVRPPRLRVWVTNIFQGRQA